MSIEACATPCSGSNRAVKRESYSREAAATCGAKRMANARRRMRMRPSIAAAKETGPEWPVVVLLALLTVQLGSATAAARGTTGRAARRTAATALVAADVLVAAAALAAALVAATARLATLAARFACFFRREL